MSKKKGKGPFETVTWVAGLSEILCETLEEKNAWKKRMLNTIHGLSFPDDFDSLDEEEKAKRLDQAIEVANELKNKPSIPAPHPDAPKE